MRSIFVRRRLAAGLCLGGVLGTAMVVSISNRTSDATVVPLDFLQPAETDVSPAPPARLPTPVDRSDRLHGQDSRAPAMPESNPPFWQDYFDASYYAASSARVPAPTTVPQSDWRRTPTPWVPIASPPPRIDFSVTSKVSISVPAAAIAPPLPDLPFANTGPFHVFVSTGPVAPVSAPESLAPVSLSSAIGTSGIPAISSPVQPVGALLRTR